MNAITVVYPDEHFFDISPVNRELLSSDTTIVLERIFEQWNHGSGKESQQFLDAEVRSLSVNDVVIVNGTYYQCKSFGWKEISEQEYLNIEKSVATHPQRFNNGAWFALQDVMYNLYTMQRTHSLA